jgi:tetratricopeptide (TPR) repeat protein
LNGSRAVSGRLGAVEADSLVLVTERGPTLLQADAIEQVESVASELAEAPPRPPEPGVVTPSQTGDWSWLDDAFTPSRTALVLPAPSFRRDHRFDLDAGKVLLVERELDRARNKHAYAVKTRDVQRRVEAIHILIDLADAAEYPPAKHLGAVLLIEASTTPGSLRQAERWLTEAVASGGPYERELAAVRLRTDPPGDALAPLAQLLAKEPPEHCDDPVLRTYLDLVASSGSTRSAASVLGCAADKGKSRLRTAIYSGAWLIRQVAPDRMSDIQYFDAGSELSFHVLDAVTGVLSSLDSGATSHDSEPPARTDASSSVRPAALDDDTSGEKLVVTAARRQLELGRSSNALAIAEKGLRSHPSSAELQGIVAQIRRAEHVPSPQDLAQRAPKSMSRAHNRQSTTFYEQAFEAETRNKNLERAEMLYRQSIAASEEPVEKAVRNLAWLLHRKKRGDEALKVMRESNVVVRDAMAHVNLMATILEHLGRWPDAAEVLEDAARIGDSPDQIRLLKWLIRGHKQVGNNAEAKSAAERLVSLDPHNAEFQSIAAELRFFQETGVSNKLDRLLADSRWVPEWSPIANPILDLHLDNCDYSGVPAARVQSQRMVEDDVHELESLARKLGPTRPGDRAAYNLSAARILRDLNLTADGRYIRCLRAFAAAMGDACAAEHRHDDVTRAYYAEAIALGRGWDDMGELKIRQFVYSYLDITMVNNRDLPKFERCLSAVVAEAKRRPLVTVGLLTLASLSESVGKRIAERIFADAELRTTIYQEIWAYLGRTGTPVGSPAEDAFAEAWQDALFELKRQQVLQRESMQLLLDRPDPLGTFTEAQRELAVARDMSVTCRTDGDRLNAVTAILEQLRSYREQTSYPERERLEMIIKNAIRQKTSEIRENPTRLSLGYLVPFLRVLEKGLTEHFQEVQRNAEPTDLEIELVVPSYEPKANSVIEIQLSVMNEPHRSPAGDVTLHVLRDDDYYAPVTAPVIVTLSLRDGETQHFLVPLHVTKRAIDEQILTFKYEIKYTVRSGRQVATGERSLSVRLSPSDDWKPIYNPYKPAGPVEDESMFFGRDSQINRLIDLLEHSETTTIVIYGQKRAGKSTVLFYLKQRLRPPLVAARFSMLDLASDKSLGALLQTIARAFYWRFDNLNLEEGYPALDVPEPKLNEFLTSRSPQLLFNDYMTKFHRAMRQSSAYRDWRLVLLLDEFTMIYAAIRSGELPADFMKSWKAMLESKMFSSVVVGNDLMPAFLSAYPNEFQVAHVERVSYLDEEGAAALITKPVRLPDGENRYRGDSVKRILQLTARSPYYIQLFCSKLIEHMKSERQTLIGPADVEKVTATLVTGENALSYKQFDSLLTPGDESASEFTDHAVLDVLRQGLAGRRGEFFIDSAGLDAEAVRVLEDLEEREVLIRQRDSRYTIRVGLFAEWLGSRKG